MGFERIRFLRHIFGGTSGSQYGGMDPVQSLQSQVELRAMLSALHEHEMSECRLSELEYATLDTETTGFSPQDDVLLSIGAVLHDTSTPVRGAESFHSLVRLPANRFIPEQVARLTGITEEMCNGAPMIDQTLQSFLQFVGDRVLVAHHAAHDIKFLNAALRKTWGVELRAHIFDTGKLSMCIHQFKKYPSLEMLLALYEVPVVNRHTALGDAYMTAQVFQRQIRLLHDMGVRTVGQLWERLLVLEHEQRALL